MVWQANLTGGSVHTADLSKPLQLGVADWVLCLETAEHIPRVHEEQVSVSLPHMLGGGGGGGGGGGVGGWWGGGGDAKYKAKSGGREGLRGG